MIATIETVFYLVVFFMIGFVLCRAKLIKPEHSKSLSTLVVYALMPATTIKSISTNFTISNLTTYLTAILVSTGIMLINIGLSFLLAKLSRKDPYSYKVYRYSSIIPNGSVGYGFAEEMLGANLVLYPIMRIPTIMYSFTFGYNLLTHQKSVVKKLINPITISLVIGIILGLLPIELPEVLQTLLSKASACSVPMCMIVIGMTVSEFKVPELFKNWKALVFCLLRLIAFPLILRLILPLFFDHSIVQVAVLLYALPCGMNPILLARMMDEDLRSGAELIMISYVIAIVSIPLVTLGLF